jgi:hypothetical protein
MMELVRVIEREEDAGAEGCIEFRVSRSRRDPNRIVAQWQDSRLVPDGRKGLIAIDQSQPGIPVEIEFARAVTCVHECGVPFLWVNDPDGLFPPVERPSFSIAPVA